MAPLCDCECDVPMSLSNAVLIIMSLATYSMLDWTLHHGMALHGPCCMSSEVVPPGRYPGKGSSQLCVLLFESIFMVTAKQIHCLLCHEFFFKIKMIYLW